MHILHLNYDICYVLHSNISFTIKLYTPNYDICYVLHSNISFTIKLDGNL